VRSDGPPIPAIPPACGQRAQTPPLENIQEASGRAEQMLGFSWGEYALTAAVIFTVVGRKDLPRCEACAESPGSFNYALPGLHTTVGVPLATWRDSFVRVGTPRVPQRSSAQPLTGLVPVSRTAMDDFAQENKLDEVSPIMLPCT
jgi:hypothetical protein